ncbi:hypothetical protein BASA81_004097 [Batrachochytrium salamandrivorans]|nr:hypothetical protein BASA81_004097 [Batrachochytrium salamandrivorans]
MARGKPIKRSKVEEEEDDESEEEERPPPKKAKPTKRAAEDEEPATKVAGALDEYYPNASGKGKVAGGFDALLTFAEGNSDKFYVVQVVEEGKFHCFTRWGKSGAKGQTSQSSFPTLAAASKEFEKKFLDKTGNPWSSVADGTFKTKAKKYELATTVAVVAAAVGTKKKKPAAKAVAVGVADLEQLLQLPTGLLSPCTDGDAKTIKTYAKLTKDHFEGGEHLFQGAFQYVHPAHSQAFGDAVKNRKLLWCGLKSKQELITALQTGALPFTPGRAGCGLYLSYTHSQAASRAKRHSHGVLLLVEVCAGKEFELTQDDANLTGPPPAYDSVLLQGRVEPNALVSLAVNGKSVKVPSGEPEPTPQPTSFSETELVVYDASLVRTRFVVAFQLPPELQLAQPPELTTVTPAPPPRKDDSDSDSDDYSD